MNSVWDSTVNPAGREPLKGDISTDVAVIGAGMCGILTAYYLQQEGQRVAVVDAGRIGSGQTHLTTAKITAQHGLYYDGLIRTVGYAMAKQYADANRKAVRQYGALAGALGADCDYRTANSYLYTRTEKGMRELEREKTAALALGVECKLDRTGVLCFPGQARFNPLPLLFAAAETLTVYENTLVTQVSGHTVHTKQGRISCKRVVFACHYPFPLVPGLYFARMHQERSYVVALKPAKKDAAPALCMPEAFVFDRDGIYYGIDEDGVSIRPWESCYLLGGEGHRTGKNKVAHRYETLRRQAEELWPGCHIVKQWSAQDCITLDNIPYIGAFSAGRPDWYVATGFHKWGMTSSMAAALILTDTICGKISPYADVFSPGRHLSGRALSTFRTEMAESGAGLAKGFLGCGPRKKPEKKKPLPPLNSELAAALVKKVAPGEGQLVSWKGRKLGVYRDETGNFHLILPQCPHLGCLLNWNPEEKTWDCPCHGSRFDCDGNLLDGPAQENLRAHAAPLTAQTVSARSV